MNHTLAMILKYSSTLLTDNTRLQVHAKKVKHVKYFESQCYQTMENLKKCILIFFPEFFSWSRERYTNVSCHCYKLCFEAYQLYTYAHAPWLFLHLIHFEVSSYLKYLCDWIWYPLHFYGGEWGRGQIFLLVRDTLIQICFYRIFFLNYLFLALYCFPNLSYKWFYLNFSKRTILCYCVDNFMIS